MKSSIEHKISVLLSKEENEQIIRLLGVKCQSLATAVIQLYLTQGPDHSQWIKKDTGIMCFVKDHMKRNYFFRLYCLNRRIMIWEQELYNNLDYKSPQAFFHTFEADDCMSGFNFASEEEAQIMKNVLLEKLAIKRQRREERRSRNSLQSRTNIQTNQVSNKSALHSNNACNETFPYGKNSVTNFAAAQPGKTKKRRHLTKADISLPSDFKHVSHVGWDPNKGFDINVEDPQLKQFFNKAGVSDRQLRDKDTRDFIYDFINTHGGLDAVKSEVIEPTKKAPFPPPKTTTDNPPLNPPPVPDRRPVNRSAPPPPPIKSRPAPTQARGQPPPRPDPIQPVSVAEVPVPPPPPPPMGDFSPPPPPIANLTSPIVNQGPDTRSALLESIRAGKSLKPVEVERKVSVGDSRSDLLKDIRQGIELKPVVQSSPRPSSGPSATENSLAEALSNALKARAFAIHSESDSDSGNSTDDEDEWEQED